MMEVTVTVISICPGVDRWYQVRIIYRLRPWPFPFSVYPLCRSSFSYLGERMTAPCTNNSLGIPVHSYRTEHISFYPLSTFLPVYLRSMPPSDISLRISHKGCTCRFQCECDLSFFPAIPLKRWDTSEWTVF